MRASRGEFDAVVAQYHDQGLIPVKLAAFGHAVNVTLGLPFVRTSVDHGTGFDIVERGIADEGSLLVAAMKPARARAAAAHVQGSASPGAAVGHRVAERSPPAADGFYAASAMTSAASARDRRRSPLTRLPGVSRSMSLRLIDSRLSWAFLPRARPISTLTRPFLK